ncbi:MAG: branched-chain amino acid ABC transporter permease [Gaiellaceae bacterium]
MSELLQLVVNGLVNGSVVALAAVGVSLVYGMLRIVNFAHGDYLTAGAYAAVLATSLGLGMVAAALLAGVAGLVLAVALEFALWRPLRRKGAGFMSLFLASIGLALVLRNVLFLVATAVPRSYPVDVFQVYAVGPIRISQSQSIAVATAFGVIALVAVLLARTTLGRSMRALADDAVLAAVTGIRVDRVVVATWALAGVLAGIAGVLAALVQSSFDPNVGFALLLAVFAAVVLGGIGSAYGALLGGLVLGVLTEVATWTELAGGVNPVYKPVVAFAVLIAALLVRPQGFFGRARIL